MQHDLKKKILLYILNVRSNLPLYLPLHGNNSINFLRSFIFIGTGKTMRVAFSIASIIFSKSFTISSFILLCSLPFIFNLYYSMSKGSFYNAIFRLFVRESLLMEFVIAYLIEDALLSETTLGKLIFTFYYTRASRVENLYFRFPITHDNS